MLMCFLAEMTVADRYYDASSGRIVVLLKDDDDKELKDLQGHWELVEMEIDGTRIPRETFHQYFKGITIKGNDFKFDGHLADVITKIKIDPTKSPKLLDFAMDDAKRKSEGGGIYSLECATLRIAMNSKSGARPKGFTAGKEDDGFIVFSFERSKKK